jgi:hypothetical protein
VGFYYAHDGSFELSRYSDYSIALGAHRAASSWRPDVNYQGMCHRQLILFSLSGLLPPNGFSGRVFWIIDRSPIPFWRGFVELYFVSELIQGLFLSSRVGGLIVIIRL